MWFNLHLLPLPHSAKRAGDSRGVTGGLSGIIIGNRVCKGKSARLVLGTASLKGLIDLFGQWPPLLSRPICLPGTKPFPNLVGLRSPVAHNHFHYLQQFFPSIFMSWHTHTVIMFVWRVLQARVPLPQALHPSPGWSSGVGQRRLSPPPPNLAAELAVKIFHLVLNHLGTLKVQMPGPQISWSDLTGPGWDLEVGMFHGSAGASVVTWAENLFSSSTATWRSNRLHQLPSAATKEGRRRSRGTDWGTRSQKGGREGGDCSQVEQGWVKIKRHF